MEKFNRVYEQVAARFQKASAIPGDYVTIKKNISSSDWYKSLDDARKEYVDGIIELQNSGKPILFGALKNGKYEGGRLEDGKYFADITVEIAPGFYQNPLTLPSDLVEFKGHRDHHRANNTDPTNDQIAKITDKPVPVEDQPVDVGNSSKIEGGDYSLATESNDASQYLQYLS